jgi:hypothetical protein
MKLIRSEDDDTFLMPLKLKIMSHISELVFVCCLVDKISLIFLGRTYVIIVKTEILKIYHTLLQKSILKRLFVIRKELFTQCKIRRLQRSEIMNSSGRNMGIKRSVLKLISSQNFQVENF